MRAAAAILAACLLASAPATAQSPTPQQVVAACIALTEAAIAGAEGARRSQLEADLELMRQGLRGLDLLGARASEGAPGTRRLPERLDECTSAG